MDFHTFARRDLQALCKRNKIPANTTNVAMADALKALELVEGIEEFMQQSQSGTAQSSTDSLEMADVTSPFVPPTAGRSTRRANIPKPAPESVNPTTRTRRTTRKAQVNEAVAFETPAVVPQTNRKKAPMASARLNMDAQLKECADEGKKDNLSTPAVVTSRRKKVEESTVTRAYSTRRSVRLSVKGSEEVSNELSGISDGDSKTDVEEKSENKEEFEVVSIGKDEFEAVSEHKQDTVEEKNDEDEKCNNFEREAEVIKLGSYVEEEKMCDNEEAMQLNDSKIVKQNDGSEVEIAVEKSSEELDISEGETTEDEAAAADFVENVILDSGDNFVVDEFYFDNIAKPIEVEPTQTETLQIEADEPCADITEKIPSSDMDVIENEPTEIELLEPEESDKAADFSLQTPTSDMDVNENEPAEIEIIEPEESEKAVDFSEQIPTSDMDVNENEPAEIEIIEPEVSEKAVDFSEQIPTSDMDVNENEPAEIEIIEPEVSEKAVDFSEQIPTSDMEETENEPAEIEIIETEESGKAVDFSEKIPTSDMDVTENEPAEIDIVEPEESEKAVGLSEQIPTTMSSTVVSDNKENVVSGDSLVIMEDVKMTEKCVKYDDMSIRKLTKMLKEKLEITKKSSKIENDNEALMSRTALQAISDNQLVDGAGN